MTNFRPLKFRPGVGSHIPKNARKHIKIPHFSLNTPSNPVAYLLIYPFFGKIFV